MATVKKLHAFWAQGANKLPEKYRANLDLWREALPDDWEVVVWDTATASERWQDFADVEARCFHHATRSDLVHARILRDIGGVLVGTDSRPARGLPRFLDLVGSIESHAVIDLSQPAIMNDLSYSDGVEVDFWAAVAAFQLRDGGGHLGSEAVSRATGPVCMFQVFSRGDWKLTVSTLRQAYTHSWDIRRVDQNKLRYNSNAYCDPGYASSWVATEGGFPTES